jgi:4-phospho-D-threonate 3-dehydrogenase / 4-phospho-D-erythronate 3-dehydrogenase
MTNKIIGITCGDINGIGLEVIIKVLHGQKLGNNLTAVVYGNTKVTAYHKNILTEENIQFNNIPTADRAEAGKFNIINCWQDQTNITLGKATEEGGQYAAIALERAVKDLKNGAIDALVTAPINKKAMSMAGFPFPGHTEYITQELGGTESVMLMVSDSLRIGLVTNHVPIAKVAGLITQKRVARKIEILAETLRMDFGIQKPTIAVLGLNPHAGDDGALGDEEINIIRPAIEQAKAKGTLVFGPFSADAFFGKNQQTKFDAVLAMYHDQGLIPFKSLAFGTGINYTAGLVGIRTSPDHGTAYDIAGKGEADDSSLLKAIYMAADLARNRENFLDMTSNPLKKSKKREHLERDGSEEDPNDHQ